MSEVKVLYCSSLFAGVAIAAERVKQDSDFSVVGEGFSLFELDLHEALERLVDLNVLHSIVDAIFLAGDFIFVALPPELHIAHELHVEVNAMHFKLKFIVQSFHGWR